MKKNIVVVGAGEVGTPIIKIEKEAGNNVRIFEYDSIEGGPTEIDVMHISIPFSRDFYKVVVNYILSYKPKITIIHSTVEPGTTEKIREHTKMSVVHSPIRGVHPHLYEGVKTFIKYVGGEKEDCDKVLEHYKSIDIKGEYLGESNETEMAKILSTTYYGANILFAKMVNKICRQYGFDFDKVYTKPNQTYNEGYGKLGMNHVIRPVLKAPTGKIGGHCVSQNFELLPQSELKKIMKELNEND